jgi:hypothetical protein
MGKSKKGSLERLVVGRCVVCGEPVHAGGNYQIAGPGQKLVCLFCALQPKEEGGKNRERSSSKSAL